MKFENLKKTIYKGTFSILDVIRNIDNLLSLKYQPIPQFTRITERFDVVERIPVLGPIYNPGYKGI